MAMRFERLLFGIAAACAAATVAIAQSGVPVVPKGDAKAGQALYMRVGCFQCHGTSGGGSAAGPKIAPGPVPFQAFAHQVRTPRSAMPVYTAVILPDRELADIYAYVQSVPPAKSYKDIALLNRDPPVVAAAPATRVSAADATGAGLYAAKCAMCHGANLEGVSGPPLKTADIGGRGDPMALAAKIKTAMPLQAPGSLSDAQATALAHYILGRNRTP
ncbi:MAG TPA: c-type cytochrome [Rhizomicrobium sp.]|nr:c-type cytochrome [Rhizomicrobium sp.]